MTFVYRGEQVDLGFGRGWLNRPAANSIRRIDRQIGHPLQITEAGRTWARQNEHYQHYLKYGSPIALNPDAPSIHQKGGAADSNEAQRVHSTMEANGWRRTVYRWVNGRWTLVEPWHYEYFIEHDKHLNDPTPTPAKRPEEDDMSIPVLLNGKHMFHVWPGGIKHLNNNSPVKGNFNHGPAHLTMLLVSSADTWVPMNSEEFLNQLDDFHIPRSVVNLENGHVLDVSLPSVDKRFPGGQHISGGAWEWARAAYANSLVPTAPLPRY